MIYIWEQKLMISMFSWDKANALDVTGTSRSTLQSIFVDVSQLKSSLFDRANLFKLPPS